MMFSTNELKLSIFISPEGGESGKNVHIYCWIRLYRSLAIFTTVFLLMTANTFAQKPADDYYHDASSMYIEGRIQQASIEVAEGLRQYPDDSKLNMLQEQLKQLQDQQNQENQKNQSQEDENQDQDEKDQKEDQDQKDDQNPEQPKDDSGEEPEDSTGRSQAEPQEPPPEGELSEKEAERLLDSYKEDEKEDLEKTRSRKNRKVQVDW